MRKNNFYGLAFVGFMLAFPEKHGNIPPEDRNGEHLPRVRFDRIRGDEGVYEEEMV